jgi:ribose transport system substrate-binding protein
MTDIAPMDTAMQRIRLSQLAFTALLGLGLAISGCTNKADETPTAAGGGDKPAAGGGAKAGAAPALTLAEPAEPADAVPSAAAKKPYHIGVSLLTQDDEFYKALKQGIQDEGDKQNVTIDILSADKDLSKQINQVQNFVASKVDAIILCPVDSSGIIGAVTAANNAGIPVFTADIASKGGNVVSHIASDNVEGGRLVGEYAGKLLNGKGTIAILDLKTITSVQDRVKGFRDALAKYPDLKILDEDVPDAKRENAVPKATNMLTAHPEINLIFGINDPVALGALSALQQAANSKVIVLGFDAVPEAQNYISAGNSPLKADAIQFPHLIGLTTVDAIIKSLNGEKVPPKIAVPTGLVTADSFKK